MRKVNIILLGFFLFVGLLVYGAKQLVQTERFAKIVSDQITDNVFNKLNTKVSFSKIKIQLLPPGAIFTDVKIEGNNPDGKDFIEGKFKNLEFDFGIIDILANRLVLKNIEGADGQFKAQGELAKEAWSKINAPANKSEQEDISLSKFFQAYLESIYGKMPVRIERIVLKDTFMQIENSSVNIDRLFLFMSDKSIEVKMILDKVSLKDWQYGHLLSEKTLLDMDLFVSADRLKIRKSELISGDEKIQFTGSIKDSDKDFVFDTKLAIKGMLQNILKISPQFLQKNEFILGNFEADFDIKGTPKNPIIHGPIKVNKFKSTWGDADIFNAEFKLQNNLLSVQNVFASQLTGEVRLSHPVTVWDFKNRKIVDSEASIHLKNLHTNSALKVLSPELDILKAKISGDMILKMDKSSGDISFEFLPGLYAEDFSLVNIKTEQNILQNKKIIFNKTTFLLKKNFDLLMEIDASFPASHIVAKGVLAKDHLEFFADKAQVNFKEFGPIVGVPLAGDALIDLHISGSYEDIRFDFGVDAKNFSVLDYQLGDAKGGVTFFLKDTRLEVKDLQGKLGESEYKGKGELAFEKESPLNLDLNFKKGRYADLRVILGPLFKVLTFMPEKNFGFLFSGPFSIRGDFDLPKLKVTGKMNAHDVQFFREDVDSFETQLSFNENVFSATHFLMKKGIAALRGKILYNLGTDFLEFDANLDKLRLQDSIYYSALNLGYTAELQGDFYGSGKLSNFSSKVDIGLTKGRVSNISVPDSALNLYSSGADVFLKGHGIGDLLSFDSYVNLSEKKSQKISYFNAKIKAPNTKILLGLLSKNNTSDETLKGNLDAELKTSFSFRTWKDFDLLFELNDFWLARKDVFLKTDQDHNKVVIKNGQIGSWDLQMYGLGNLVKSTGEGSFLGKINIQNNFEIDASLIEMLSDHIQKVGGKLKGRSVLVGDHGSFSHYFELFGEKLNIKIANIPNLFEEIQLGLVLDNNSLFIKDFRGRYGKGDFSVDGNVKIKVPSPFLDLGINLKNSYIPLFKKSYAVASGKIKITGESFPYRVEGNLSLQQSEILDEFSDITGKGGDSSVQNRFVPKNKNSPVVDFVTLSLDWDILRPVLIKNSQTEIKLDGSGKIAGGNSAPTILGELNLLSGESKFYFKGHEFIISEGKILFNNPLLRNQADVRIVGQAEIGQYKVKVLITGKNDSIALALNSEPYLSQEDIFSLLAIGVTSDVSRGMGETERRSMTSLGLGTLLMDQMRLNQGLTSQLGLKLSVIPEFSEDESAVMAGRSESSGQSASRVKSTTKIKIQKKVSNKVDVSVASTMGGTMEQKQEMNINWNFHKNIGLQGVYEMKASDNTENAPSEISAGADLKFKWSFK